VGHSWGGAVITQAGEDPKVVGLVYVAAYAPEVGQSANDASGPYGWTDGQKQIRVDSDKFATVTSEGMLNDIAEGLPMAERMLALAVQGQSYGPMFDEKLTVAAWETKPTWAIISSEDRMLPPAMEEAAARRMGAVTITLPTCHMLILQKPEKVAEVIDQAAKTALSKNSAALITEKLKQ
jgi:pimeloyl-ACP methyl ester carboxylesterase